MTDLKRLADIMERGEYDVAAHKEAATLLRSAAAETVGTMWANHPDGKLMCNAFADATHNRDLSACRLALVAARKERDEARADAAWWMDTVREVCNHVLGNDRWDPRDRAVGTPIVQAVAAVRKERDEAAKMAYMILPSDDRNPGVTWREAYEMLDEKFLGEKHGHDCAMSTIAEERAALQRAIDEAIIFVEGHLTDENRRKLLAATLRPHATPSQPEREKEERQWSSTPPQDRSGKWWHSWIVDGKRCWNVVPMMVSWKNAMDKMDGDLWLPYIDGDTRDGLPPLPTEPKVDHLKPLIERHEATIANLREISEGVKRMIDTPPLPNSSATVTSSPAPASRPCDCRELVARLTECVEALASRRVFPHFLRDIIRDARGGEA